MYASTHCLPRRGAVFGGPARAPGHASEPTRRARRHASPGRLSAAAVSHHTEPPPVLLSEPGHPPARSAQDMLLQKNTKMQSDEEIIEMMNGCICCTVRQERTVVCEGRALNGSPLLETSRALAHRT